MGSHLCTTGRIDGTLLRSCCDRPSKKKWVCVLVSRRRTAFPGLIRFPVDGQLVKSPSLGRINTYEPLSSGNTHDAALHQEAGYRKTHRRGPCPRSPNLEAAREQRPREKPCPAIALRGFQRAPGTGKLLAYYSNGPSWKTQLPAILPHSGRGLPGPFRMRYSLGTIHGNQIQETWMRMCATGFIQTTGAYPPEC